ncbi:hypothetical protein ACFE04_009917 [Oxalis oulophora]
MAGTKIQPLILFTLPPSSHFKMSSFHHRMPRVTTTQSNTLSITTNRNRRIPSSSSFTLIIRASSQHQSNQVDDDSNNWAKPLLKVVSDNFLPLALVAGVLLGLANPTLGCIADKYYMSKFSTFGIFIISGLTLRSEEIGAAVEAWPVAIFGLCSILLFTPYFSKMIMQIQLQPQEFITGLAIFTCMPTTLSSGVALTQLAGGNSALALAMTVISNLLGILIVPFSISKFIAAGVGVSVPTEQLFKNLVLMLLVPLILGKVLRESSKGAMDTGEQVKVAVVNGQTNNVCSRNWDGGSISAVSGGGQSIFSKKENLDATLIVASQKTLPVMVAVVEQLGGAFGESGLLVLPCVAAHINQIILDSFLVNFWLRKDLPSDNVKVA